MGSNTRINLISKVLSAVFMVSMLASCNSAEGNYTDSSDLVMNSGIPFYKTDDAIYYCEKEGTVYSILEQKNDGTINCIDTESEYEAVTSIYVSGEYLYNTVIDSSNELRVERQNINSGEEIVLFEDKTEGLIQFDDYIYAENDTVYYFKPKSGLWIYKDGAVSYYLQDAYDCVITGDGIYYSDSNGISAFDAATGEVTSICTKENVFDSFKEDRMLNVLGYGGGYITNLLYRDKELYFLLSDFGGGGMFKLTQGLESLERIMPDVSVNRFNFDNDKLYFYGKGFGEDKRALYVADSNGNVSKIDDGGGIGFYVKDDLYYYTDPAELHIVPIE